MTDMYGEIKFTAKDRMTSETAVEECYPNTEPVVYAVGKEIGIPGLVSMTEIMFHFDPPLYALQLLEAAYNAGKDYGHWEVRDGDVHPPTFEEWKLSLLEKPT